MEKFLEAQIKNFEKLGGEEGKDSVRILKQIIADLKDFDSSQIAGSTEEVCSYYEEVVDEKIRDEVKDFIILVDSYERKLDSYRRKCLELLINPYAERKCQIKCQRCKKLKDKHRISVDILSNYFKNKGFERTDEVNFKEGWQLVRVDRKKKEQYDKRESLRKVLIKIIKECIVHATGSSLSEEIISKEIGMFDQIIEKHLDQIIEKSQCKDLVQDIQNYFETIIEDLHGRDTDRYLKTMGEFVSVLTEPRLTYLVKFWEESYNSENNPNPKEISEIVAVIQQILKFF